MPSGIVVGEDRGENELGDTKVPQPRAMIDACVMYKAAVFRFLVGAAQTGLYVARWTDLIRDETTRNLRDDRRDKSLVSLHESLGMLLDPIARAASPNVRAEFRLTDPKDRHVAAAAASDRCSHIVTENVRHFDLGEAANHRFEVVHHDAFGVLLFELNAAAVIAHIDRTPLDRLERYLTRLEAEMPNTVELVRPYLEESPLGL